MYSKDAFQALDDMAKMGLRPTQSESNDEPMFYESLPGIRPEDRVVPPGYVSVNALLDEASAMGEETATEHVLLEN